ncbi:MAG: cytochrome c biogenesis CcdA family protein [Mobiluncus porci]|uniref:cytochrome c biogenesis CcdA family protein n=1 Tax=Mobiluncus TaxID=2050 RepID=UPI0023F19CD6|nr:MULTISPECIES: cytochrome c biogenesis CcdA family protein [Mobiluncus]MCI6585154.1 cytochrome c biogenesis CcdA family protein [Mobiluncus sp.]MDD7541746.1 cytochrome c biogenesis CcdA family protein [Mobiluncus porci]MDY5747994.1 cytochrome c biogenesis CcdA family protein [Mobiluncus porci]
MGSVSFAVAYVGGLLTLFSPCSALLIPSFFAYAFSSRARLASRIMVFFAGLLAGLLPLGVALGALGNTLSANRATITFWAGLAIIAFGLWQVLALPTPSLSGLKLRWKCWRNRGKTTLTLDSSRPKDHTSPVAVFLLGLTYGLAATGCSGPITGAISAFAISGGSPVTGFFIMLFFAAGMFTPVVILAFFWDKIPSRFVTPRAITVFGRPSTVGNLISGVVFVILGVVMAVFGGGGLSSSLLSVSQQLALENAAMQLLRGVPNWLFIVLAVLLGALVVVYLKGRRSR